MMSWRLVYPVSEVARRHKHNASMCGFLLLYCTSGNTTLTSCMPSSCFFRLSGAQGRRDMGLRNGLEEQVPAAAI